jgi:GNAT superfamily N-acetyltransferase
MAGLLDGVLPYVYGRGDWAKRQVTSLLGDPRGAFEQAAGNIQDQHRAQMGLLGQAFADPRRPFDVTNQQALGQAAQNMLNGPLGFAPVGMIDAKALQSAFPDIDFTLSQSGNKATLSKVVVPPEMRGQGVGADFMEALTKAADADKAQLALSPSSDFGGNKARLIDFYKRYGFVPNKGRNIDFEISESMYRTPR